MILGITSEFDTCLTVMVCQGVKTIVLHISASINGQFSSVFRSPAPGLEAVLLQCV